MKKSYHIKLVSALSVFVGIALISGCASAVEKQPPVSSTSENCVVCKDPRKDICTREYRPVCGRLSNGSVKTYSNPCTACSHAEVVSYTPGPCSQ